MNSTLFSLQRVFRQRELLYYRHGLEETKTQIEQMRKKNESLIYNILPSHVAKDFIGTRKSDEVNDFVVFSYIFLTSWLQSKVSLEWQPVSPAVLRFESFVTSDKNCVKWLYNNC